MTHKLYRTYEMPFGLTDSERLLAQWLIYFHGRTVSYVILHNAFFGMNESYISYGSKSYLYTLVARIRKKWSDKTDRLDIETVRGTGYRLVYR